MYHNHFILVIVATEHFLNFLLHQTKTMSCSSLVCIFME